MNSARRFLQSSTAFWLVPIVAFLCNLQIAYGDATVGSAPELRAEVINPTLSGGMHLPRSNVLLLWGTDGSIWRSEAAGEWLRAATRTDADLRALASNVDGSILIAVGERGAILRSTDRGFSWSTVSPASTSSDLRTVIHHVLGDVWIAAGTNGTILRSIDDGRSWAVLRSPMPFSFDTLMTDARADRILIGGEQGTVGVSTDRGESWRVRQIDMPGERTPITRFHRLGDRALIGTSAYGRIVISRDAGERWELMETGARGFFTAGAVARGELWLGTHTGELWRSSARGSRFERVMLGAEREGRYISAIHHDPRKHIMTIIGHGGLLVRKIGDRLEEISPSIADLEALVAGSGGRVVAAGAGALIMESRNAGMDWRVVNATIDTTMREVIAVPNTTTLVSVGMLGIIARSTDAGKHWRKIDVRYPNENTPPTLRALHFDAPHNALIAAGPPGTILRSMDQGASWQLTHWTPLEAEEAFPWLLPLAKRGAVLAIEARGAFYRSADAGERWKRAELETALEFWHGATLHDRNMSIVAGQGGVAAVSTDGSGWRIVETGVSVDLYGSFADERDGALFLMGENGVLLRSSDLGETWQALTSGVDDALRRMVRDPRSGALLAFGAGGSIVRSRDGITWHTVTSGTTNELRKAMIDPDTNDIIVVGSHGTAIRSTDGGITWQAIATNTRRHFRGATIDERGHLIAVGERIVRIARTRAAPTSVTNDK